MISTKTFIVSALLALSLTVFAKTQDDGKLGVLAGWSSTSTSADNSRSISGFYAGAVWEHKIIPSLRFHSGLVYNQNGYRPKNDVSNLDRATYGYLNVPIIAKVQVANFYALAGAKPGIRLGGKYSYNDGSADQKISKDNFRGHDVAAQLGLGFNIAIIGIEGRYNWGLTDLNKTDAGGSIYNRYFELGLHVKLL